MRWLALSFDNLPAHETTEDFCNEFSLPTGSVRELRRFTFIKAACVLADEEAGDRLTTAKSVIHIHRPSVLPDSTGKWYVGLLTAWEKAITEGARFEASVVNMSLGPPEDEDYPFSADEPLNRATSLARSSGIEVVLAAGNGGEAGNNTLTRWAQAPWVIRVGATDPKGRRVERYSARGAPGDLTKAPTVVAPSADDIHGGGGTSFAAQHVSDVVLLLEAFAVELLKEVSHTNLPHEARRLLISCFVADSLRSMARSVRGEPHERGAGFVNISIAMRFVQRLTVSLIHQLMPLLGEVTPQRLNTAKYGLDSHVTSFGRNSVARISIDTEFTWSLPTFVPGVLNVKKKYLLSSPNRIDRSIDIDYAETRLKETGFIQLSIRPREQFGRHLFVGKGEGQYPTIMEAMNAADQWDVITVLPGIYSEAVVVKSGITLRGEPGASIQSTDHPLVISDARDISIQDLRITSVGESAPAVLVLQGTNVSFINCHLSGPSLALQSYASRRVQFDSCKLRGGKNAAYVAYSSQIKFKSGCDLVGVQCGLLSYASAVSLIGSSVTGETADAILHVASNQPWTRRWVVPVYDECGRAELALRWLVSPTRVRDEDLCGRLSQLFYALMVHETQLIAGNAAIAATTFDAVLYSPHYTEATWSHLATVRGRGRLPVNISGLNGADALAKIHESIRPLYYTPTFF